MSVDVCEKVYPLYPSNAFMQDGVDVRLRGLCNQIIFFSQRIKEFADSPSIAGLQGFLCDMDDLNYTFHKYSVILKECAIMREECCKITEDGFIECNIYT